MTANEEAPVSTWGFSRVAELRLMELSDCSSNYSETSNASQTRPWFSWPRLRSAIEFYEKERLCYLPAGWGRKNPTVEWKEFQARLPTMEERADWFHEGKATNIGVLCGAVSGGLVILAFNTPDGAIEFFGKGLSTNSAY